MNPYHHLLRELIQKPHETASNPSFDLLRELMNYIAYSEIEVTTGMILKKFAKHPDFEYICKLSMEDR